MPPPLALLLCTVFVLYLLRFERRHSADVSSAVWLPILWLFSIGTKPIGVWLASSGGDETSSPLDQYFGIVLLCLGLLVLARRRFDWGGFVRSHPWLFLFVGYMLASSFWAELPFVCFKRGIRQVLAVVMAAVVLSESDPRQAVESILRRTAYILIPFSMLLIKYYPHFGVEFGRWSGERMWVGVAQQKNGLARVCIIAGLFLLWSFVNRGWRGFKSSPYRWAVLAEVMVLLLGSYMLFIPEGKNSATSILALGVGVGVCTGLRWLNRRAISLSAGVLVSLVLLLVVLGIALPLTGGRIGGGLNAALGRDETFTGRADTWAELVPLALQHPVLGCGFDSYWTPVTRELHRMSHAHNAYLEVFNELGFVGLGLFAMFWCSVARAAQRTLAWRFDWGALCTGYLLMALVHGMAESSINSFTGQLAGVLLLVAVSCAVPFQSPGAGLAYDQDGETVSGNQSNVQDSLVGAGAGRLLCRLRRVGWMGVVRDLCIRHANRQSLLAGGNGPAGCNA